MPRKTRLERRIDYLFNFASGPSATLHNEIERVKREEAEREAKAASEQAKRFAPRLVKR